MKGKDIWPSLPTMKPGALLMPVGSICWLITAPALGSSSGWSYTTMPMMSLGPMV